MLAEELKPTKRERNPQQNWVEQKKKKREGEKKGIRTGLALLRGSCEREKEATHPGKPPNQYRDQLRWTDLKVNEKSSAAGLRRAKQSESLRDYRYHHSREHSLRC